MTIGHLNDDKRPFKPTGKGGGSKKGKPQTEWPWVLKIIAHAILVRAKGSSDAWKVDRKQRLSRKEFGRRMDAMCPGWREWARENKPGVVTPLEELLSNRVYKMYYSGTSDRGSDHDPATRACESKEHWTKHFAATSMLGQLHERVERGEVCVENWKDYL